MKKIVFMLIPLLVTLLAFSPDYSFTVKGTVLNDARKPIPYAIIEEKLTKTRAQADDKGNFTITVQSENATLVIIAAGYATKEIQLKGNALVNVSLKANKNG